MTEREALKLVLEALLHAYHEDEAHPKTLEVITAIKEYMAQPEQERCEYCKRGLKTMCLCGMKAQPEQEPCRHRIADIRNEAVKSGYMCMDCGALFGAYTIPPQRKPLTDEEIGRIAGDSLDAWSCARAIESAHGIKE